MFYLYIYNNICCLLTININNTYILTCNISIKKKGGGGGCSSNPIINGNGLILVLRLFLNPMFYCIMKKVYMLFINKICLNQSSMVKIHQTVSGQFLVNNVLYTDRLHQ